MKIRKNLKNIIKKAKMLGFPKKERREICIELYCPIYRIFGFSDIIARVLSEYCDKLSGGETIPPYIEIKKTIEDEFIYIEK
jgi:hypothetical protein